MTRPALELLLLRDRRPGHFHQVEGLALAIGRIHPVSVTRLEVRRRKLTKSGVIRVVAARRRFFPGFWLNAFYGIDPAWIGKPAAVIASGDVTIGAGLLISRLTGAKFILCGFPKGYDLDAIDLLLNSETLSFADAPGNPFLAIPNRIDPDLLPAPKKLHALSDLAGAELSLLIGGNATGVHFSDRDWNALAGLVAETSRFHGILWQVSSSSRTPDEASSLFRRLAWDGIIKTFIDFRVEGPGSADGLFAADAIVVTADSRSMASEALTARRPVIAMRPSTSPPASAAMLTASGVACLPLIGTDARSFVETLLSLPPAAYDPRDLIAAAVAPVLGLAWPPVDAGREPAALDG